MKLEEQVVSLALAKQLKEIGIQQESLYIWQQTTDGRWYVHDATLFDWGSESYPAFTVAELGELLPFGIESSKKVGIPSFGWRVVLDIPTQITHTEEADTEADARAKMLIYLKTDKRR